MLSIVIVNWNTRDYLRQCLESIRVYLKDVEEMEVVVVDNASSDKSAEMVKKLYPWVKLIENNSNVGFGFACNIGCRYASGDILAFINPDVRFYSDSIKNILVFFDEQPNVGIVAPKLEYDNGTPQPSVRRFPTPWIMFLLLVKLSRIAGRLTSWKRYNYSNFTYQDLRSVDQVMGAALFIRRQIFTDIGQFDQNFFVWFEEVDLCKRVKEAGYLIFFLPEAVVYHSKSRAFTQQSLLRRNINFSKSARYYASKHFSRSGNVIVWLASWVSVLLAIVLAPFDRLFKQYQATEK